VSVSLGHRRRMRAPISVHIGSWEKRVITIEGRRRPSASRSLSLSLKTRRLGGSVERISPIFDRISNEFLPFRRRAPEFGHNKRGITSASFLSSSSATVDARQVIVVRAILRQFQSERSDKRARFFSYRVLLKLEEPVDRLWRRFGLRRPSTRDSRISPVIPSTSLIHFPTFEEQCFRSHFVEPNISAGWIFSSS